MRVERESEKDSDRAPLRVSLSRVDSATHVSGPKGSRSTGTRRGRRRDPGPVGRVGCRGGLVPTWVPSCRSSVRRSRAYAIRETGGLPAPRDCKGLVRGGRSGVMYVLYVRVSLLFGALPPVAIDDQRRNRLGIADYVRAWHSRAGEWARDLARSQCDLLSHSLRTRVSLSVTRPRNLSVTLSGSAAPTALCEDCAVRSLYPAA